MTANRYYSFRMPEDTAVRVQLALAAGVTRHDVLFCSETNTKER